MTAAYDTERLAVALDRALDAIRKVRRHPIEDWQRARLDQLRLEILAFNGAYWLGGLPSDNASGQKGGE